MKEPNPRTSRLALAGGLVVAIALASAGFLIGRSTMPELKAPAPPPTSQPSSIPTPEVLDEFDRAALLALVSRAADAFASNRDVPAEVLAATGRRFDLVIPFGCDGPSDPNSSAAMRWRYDAQRSTLRAAAVPRLWRAVDWGIAPGGNQTLDLRGFWVTRPWSSATACTPSRSPGTGLGPGSVPLPEESLAIARWVEGGDNGKTRSFEIVRRLSAQDFAAAQGLRLRIVGRITAPAGASPVRCIQAQGAGRRPSCLITASFNEVRIENPANDAILGVWPISDVPGETE